MGLTADQKYLLNNQMGKVGETVQLGTLVDNAYADTGQPLTSAHLLVGNGSGVAADVAVSGDLTMDNAGAFTIAASAVTNTKVSASAAIAYSKLNLATSIVNADVGSSAAIAYSKLALTGSVAVADFANAVMLEATGTLSQANIQAMNGTPVSMIAAPGAGKLIIVDEIEFLHTYSTTAYTNGGDVSIQYHTSATPIQVFDVALVTATSTQNFLWKPSASYTSTASTSSQTDLSTSANLAVEITNGTAAFATGHASNIFKYRIRYHIVTLLT